MIDFGSRLSQVHTYSKMGKWTEEFRVIIKRFYFSDETFEILKFSINKYYDEYSNWNVFFFGDDPQ